MKTKRQQQKIRIALQVLSNEYLSLSDKIDEMSYEEQQTSYDGIYLDGMGIAIRYISGLVKDS